MRLGLYGGSFDPVHLGHLLLAECCREQCALDQVWFLPAAVSPHKQGQTAASAEQRVEMLSLAIGGHEGFDICMHEVERGGVSYTVDTLRELKEQDPQRELLLLMGADTLADLVNWRDPEEICRLAVPVVVDRAGAAEPDYACLQDMVEPERLKMFRRHRVEMPIVELSSREIRHRVATGKSLRYRVTRAVEKYIEATGIYQHENG